MPRVKRGAKRAHKRKKVLKLSSGFYGTKSNAYRMAMQAVDQGNLSDAENKLKWGKIISIVGFAIGVVLSLVFSAIWIAQLVAAAH